MVVVVAGLKICGDRRWAKGRAGGMGRGTCVTSRRVSYGMGETRGGLLRSNF